jgi:hypothetical protein
MPETTDLATENHATQVPKLVTQRMITSWNGHALARVPTPTHHSLTLQGLSCAGGGATASRLSVWLLAGMAVWLCAAPG